MQFLKIAELIAQKKLQTVRRKRITFPCKIIAETLRRKLIPKAGPISKGVPSYFQFSFGSYYQICRERKRLRATALQPPA